MVNKKSWPKTLPKILQGEKLMNCGKNFHMKISKNIALVLNNTMIN
jgi:hypothetical protein